MAKYDGLGHYLKASGKDEVRLSFVEIERILGFALPRSAYTYSAWWANGGHTQADSWTKVGYLSGDLDIPGKTVTFRRTTMHTGDRRVSTEKTERSVPAVVESPTKPAKGENGRDRLTVAGYSFEYVQNLIPECRNGSVVEYYPQSNYRNEEHLPLLHHGSGAFCRFFIQATEASGVYLWVTDGEIIYIGETSNLKQRFNVGYGNISPRNCFLGGQSTNCKMNKVVMEYYRKGKPIALYFHQTPNYKQVELDLLKRFCTKYNVKDN